MATLLTTEQINETSRTPREVELPAPTAWPFILACGATLIFAGLVTSPSVSVLGGVLSLAGCTGWFREIFPHEHEEVVPVVAEDLRVTTERRIVELLPDRTSSARVAPCKNLSGISGRERRTSGVRCNGDIGLRLWPAEDGKHLVSNQPSGRMCVRRITQARVRAGVFIPCRQLCDCFGPACHRVYSCRFTLWRYASHVSTPSHCARRANRSGTVVGAPLLNPWLAEPIAHEPY